MGHFAAKCQMPLKGLSLSSRHFLAARSSISTSPAFTYPKISAAKASAPFYSAKPKNWAKKKGGKKLYISAHSAVETQAFYQMMGCVDAEEYDPHHVEAEPFDRQLECIL